MKKIKYIENDITKGIQYDYKHLKNIYDSLGIPKTVFKPPIMELETNHYLIELSDRSRGKTTNWLLFGLCMNREYGTIIQYIRQKETMLAPKFATELVTVINEFNNGQYIKNLTDNKYNALTYHWGKFYYALIDENGKILERAERHCIQCLSVDKNLDYKSGYNAPLGDLIIFDEFLSKYYSFNECIDFLDLCSTIIRQRFSPRIILLANTIKTTSQYFEEFTIQRSVRGMEKGEHKNIVTDGGTHIFFEILASDTSENKQKHNTKFFGFKNPKLASITGSSTWALENVPHIPQCEHEVINNRLYIELNTYEYLQCEFVCRHDNMSNALFVHYANKPKSDSIILTLSNDRKERYLYGTGNKKIHNLLYNMLAKRNIFYSSNEVGNDFKNYLRSCKENPYDLL